MNSLEIHPKYKMSSNNVLHAGPYPEFFMGGGLFSQKLDLFFYKCHCIYRYIQDEILENVSHIKKKNWVCGLCPSTRLDVIQRTDFG